MRKRLFAITTMAKIGIRRWSRDRTALFFTIAFPLIFLFIFGALFGKDNSVSFNIALIDNAHTQFSQQFSNDLNHNKLFKVNKDVTSYDQAKEKMNRGQIDATIILPQGFGATSVKGYPSGQAQVYYDQNNEQAGQTLGSVLQGIFQGINAKYVQYTPPFTVATKSTNTSGLSSFDYIFSGMLGFSLIGLGIFGPTNSFPEQKKQGILRRLRSTPVTAVEYIVSNVLSYVVLGIISLSVMMVVGLSVFHLHMRGNYFNLYALLILGIITLFGFGMAIGGWAKNENQAAPLSNLVAFPLMFLSGIFFPTFLMPSWLQTISHYMPLTPIVDSIRMVITENRGLLDLGPQLAIVGAWMVIIYIVAFRLFRWE